MFRSLTAGEVPRRGPRAFLEKFGGGGLEEIRRNDDTYLASLKSW
jgi:hypothetical protein